MYKVLLVGLLFSGILFGQEIGDLEKRISKLEKKCQSSCLSDTLLIREYNKAFEIRYEVEPEIAYSYNQKALSKAKELEVLVQEDIISFKRLNTLLSKSYIDNGTYLMAKGEMQEASRSFFNSLDLSSKLLDTLLIAGAYNNIAVVHLMQGGSDSALYYFDKTLEFKETIKATSELADVYGNKGYLYYMQGDIERTLDLWKKSGKIFKECNDIKGSATVINNIGMIYNGQGDKESALEYFQSALKMRKDANLLEDIANSLNNVASVLDDIGEQDKAMKYYEEGFEIHRSNGNKEGMIYVANNLGYLLEHSGQIDKALEYYKYAYDLSLEKNNLEKSCNVAKNIATLYYGRNQMKEANYYTNKAYEFSLKLQYPYLTKYTLEMKLDMAIVNNDIDSANYFSKELLDILERSTFSNFVTMSEDGQEKFLSQVTLRNIYDNVYSYYIDNKGSTNNSNFLNAVIKKKGLLLKSSTGMKNAIQSSKDTLLILKYNQWLELKKIITKNYTEGKPVGELDKKANRIEEDLVRMSSEFSDFDNLKKLNWSTIKSKLSANEVVVEFLRFDKYTFFKGKKKVFQDSTLYGAFVYNQKSDFPEFLPLFEESELTDIIGKNGGSTFSFIHELYGERFDGNTDLYDLIWKPLEKYVNDGDKIFYAPDGLLHKLSFKAFSKNDDSYLMDEHDLIQIASSSELLNRKANLGLERDASVMAIGGVEYSTDINKDGVWPFLEGTKNEVEQITSLLKKKKYEVNSYYGKEATEELLKNKAPKSQALHVSTHGFFFPDPNSIKEDSSESFTAEVAFRGAKGTEKSNVFALSESAMMRSGLVLSGANDIWSKSLNDSVGSNKTEDGVLTAMEVSQLDLRGVDLVVLSACETGLGDIKEGEGVYGLQRSFKMAGASNLIISLWQVPDKETMEFMITFYKFLTKGKSITESFSKTQMRMKNKYDPYYWAAFVLVQ